MGLQETRGGGRRGGSVGRAPATNVPVREGLSLRSAEEGKGCELLPPRPRAEAAAG